MPQQCLQTGRQNEERAPVFGDDKDKGNVVWLLSTWSSFSYPAHALGEEAVQGRLQLQHGKSAAANSGFNQHEQGSTTCMDHMMRWNEN